MQKLYQVSWTKIKNREALYFKTQGNASVADNVLSIKQDGKVDLLTYFNCFSLCQWKRYTTIKKLCIKGCINGKANVEIIGLSKNGSKVLHSITVNGEFEQDIDVLTVDTQLLGLNIIAIEDCCIKNIAYYGDFEKWQPLKIGVSICTFKREDYVTKTMAKLLEFSAEHSWLSTLVVDNGSTLDEIEQNDLRIIHNPNYGGSGGFTRGLIENLERKENDYVLLMDDDIDLDATAIERTHSLLCGLKKEYQDCFLSGAMLRMEEPCIQHENTAYWGKIRLNSLGQGWNLSDIKSLLDNEAIPKHKNQYGAWWYCFIPIKRISEIGLPLPVFIKGDDMEYGIRNQREVIHMNGIGVWHMAFAGKVNDAINYFSDRNMLMINQYADGCNRFTLFAAIVGRLTKRLLKGNFTGVRYLNLAVNDFCAGLEELTKKTSDEKFAEVRAFSSKKNIVIICINIISLAVSALFNYAAMVKSYNEFRNTKLQGTHFWKDFLKINEER